MEAIRLVRLRWACRVAWSWCPAVGLAMLSAVAMGCSSAPPDDPDLEAWVREVRVLEPNQIGDRRYEELASLEERQPIGITGEESAISEARHRLKRRAAKVDADAIVIVACGADVGSSDRSSLADREPSVVCRGVAIRWVE